MSLYVQALLSGLAIGALYGVLGLGFTFVFRVTGVLNIAQAAVALVSGLAYARLFHEGWSIPAAASAALVIGSGIGFITGIGVSRWWDATEPYIAVLLTLAFEIVLIGICGVVFGNDPWRGPPLVGLADVSIAGAILTGEQLLLILGAIGVSAAFSIWLSRGRRGKVFRAIVDDEFGAQAIGVQVRRWRIAAFALAGTLAAVAGILYVPVASLEATVSGPVLLANGLAASIVGGLTNPSGALLGGVILGIVQTMALVEIGSVAYVLVIPTALIAVLVLRPEGILPARAVRSV